eukprot:2606333-Rhodomonas_salina.4
MQAIFFYSAQDNRVYKVSTLPNTQPEFVAGNTRTGHQDGMGANALFTNDATNVKMLQTMENGNVLMLDDDLIRIINPTTNIVETLSDALQGAYSIATLANNAQEKGMVLYTNTKIPPTMTQLQQLNTLWAHDMDQLYEHQMLTVQPLQNNQRIVQITVKTAETAQASYDAQMVILTNDGKLYPHKVSLCNYGMVWNGQQPSQSCTRLPCERSAACSALEIPATGSNVCQCKPGYYRPSDNAPCGICPLNHWCTGGSNKQPCSSYIVGSISKQGTSNSALCLCQQGEPPPQKKHNTTHN